MRTSRSGTASSRRTSPARVDTARPREETRSLAAPGRAHEPAPAAPAAPIQQSVGNHAVAGLTARAPTSLDRVEILELFPPTTLDGYRSGIYKDPGEFIR